MSLFLRLYNNWLPSSGWTILIAYLLIKENCTPFSYVNTILCIGHFDAHSPALSWELASNNWTLWLKPMSSAFMPTTFTISHDYDGPLPLIAQCCPSWNFYICCLHSGRVWRVNHSVHAPPFLHGGRGVEPPTKFSERRGLTGPQLLEGLAGKERVTFFTGGGGGGAAI